MSPKPDDWKHEAYQAYVARWRAHEAAVSERRRQEGKVTIWLERGPEDAETFTREHQMALRTVVAAFEENAIDVDAPFMTLDAADAIGGYTGEIAVLATAFGPVLTGILGAWLQSKTGRKVKLKDGDIEIEAQSVEDVRKLLEMVAEQRAKRDEKESH